MKFVLAMLAHYVQKVALTVAMETYVALVILTVLISALLVNAAVILIALKTILFAMTTTVLNAYHLQEVEVEEC
jgi:hypothetical protein